ncbi:MAG: ISNCY family transposase [Lactobacillaceae bacterium]|jgi:transposase|nr:ISNCY family transposase [Lactobacillaceae bacterium]
MRKVELTSMEQDKYKAIKLLVENKSNIKATAIKLEMTEGNVRRLVKKYKQFGKAGFSHKNKGNKHARKIDSKLVDFIISKQKLPGYENMSVTQFNEHLKTDFDIDISTESLRQIFIRRNVFTDQTHKVTLRTIRQNLNQKLDKGKVFSLDEASTFRSLELLDEINAYPRRERVKYSGELIQMDASKEDWYLTDDEKITLHIAIDDATGLIVGANFQREETLLGYQVVLAQLLNKYGVPSTILTDNRTIFNYRSSHDIKDSHTFTENDPLTQFGFTLNKLGVELKTSSIPQVKGRIERLIKTIQIRLMPELKLRGIDNLADANKFLKTYVNELNDKFSLKMDVRNNVYSSAPTKQEQKLLLARRSKRTVDNGNSIVYKNNRYMTYNKESKRVLLEGGVHGMVIETMDGELFFDTLQNTYAMVRINQNSQYSKEFDNSEPLTEINIKWIPYLSHPYKYDSYLRYLNKRKKTVETSSKNSVTTIRN